MTSLNRRPPQSCNRLKARLGRHGSLRDFATALPVGLSPPARRPNRSERIRTLNDDLRQHLLSGGAVITPGVAGLGHETADRIVQAIAAFDDFCEDNDPYEEHDFGAFDVDGTTIFFKIDYYDKTLTGHFPDPADPAVTERIITIMLADEY